VTTIGTLFRALVAGYVRAHALRASVTLFAVALGVASAYAIDLANATAVDSFSSSVNVVANRVNVQVFGTGDGFDERALLPIERANGVYAASPVVEGEITVGGAGGPLNGEILRVMGIDITRAVLPPGVQDAQNGAASFDLHRFIDQDGVFVSRRVAEQYGAFLGGSLHGFIGARAVALPVMGVIPPKTVGVDSSVAFVDIATAQQLFASVGRLDRIDIIADPARVDAVRATVARLAPPGARVLTPKTRVDEISRMLSSFTMNLAALADVALLVGMYLIYNAVAISVVQRFADIGTLRALGTTRAQIFWTFVLEGALYGVVGSLLGLVLGLALAHVSLAAVETTVSALYVGSHADAVHVGWLPTLKAFALGTLLSMAAAALPARGAAATPPARTMRNTGAAERRNSGFSRRLAAIGALLLVLAYGAARLPAIGDGIPLFGYAAGILAIAGVSLATPLILLGLTIPLRAVSHDACVTIAAAFLRASPRRIGVAVASLTVAVAMMVAIAVLVGSFRTTIVAWANDALKADLYITTPGRVDASLRGGFTPSDRAKIARVRGVSAVDTYRGLEVPIDGRYAELGATDMSGLTAHNKLRFIGNADPAAMQRALIEHETAIVSVPFSTHFNLRPGDSIPLDTPSGRVNLKIVGEYNDYSTSGGTFFIDTSTFRRLYGDSTYDSIAVYLAPRAQAGLVRSGIERALAPLHVDINTSADLRTFALQVFDRTFAITNALYIVSIVIAVLGVVSTLFALVLERRIDIALLRYIGLSRAGVQGVVFVQALAIGVLSGALGLVLGVGLAADLIYVINRQSFGWLIEWHSPGIFYLEAFAMVVIAAVIAAIYPARVAAAIHSSEVLRVE
jgi:putative ABC transport system permease protein